MTHKFIDPMEGVRLWKRQLSRELNEARHKGNLLEKLEEIARRNKKVIQHLKKARVTISELGWRRSGLPFGQRYIFHTF